MGGRFSKSKIPDTLVACILSALLLVVPGFSFAEVAGPGWIMGTAEPVTPETARAYYRSRGPTAGPVSRPLTTGTSGFEPVATVAAMSSFETAPEIVALALALQNDPKLIYEFIHNNIDYVPYYGYLKGPVLTLLDRSGNDFDQAALMVALLRASGLTADFVFGQMTIPNFGARDQLVMQNWLAVDADINNIINVLSLGGIPHTTTALDTTLDRLWVKASIGGTDYLFDPAFKVYTETTGIDLKTAMGYTRTDLLTAAGGTLDTDSIQNLNDAGLAAKLAQYSGNLVGYLRSNLPNAAVEEVISGRSIVPDFLDQLPTGLVFPGTVTAVWAEIPAAYVHTVRIQHGGIDQTLHIPDITAHKLAISYDTGTAAVSTVSSLQTTEVAAVPVSASGPDAQSATVGPAFSPVSSTLSAPTVAPGTGDVPATEISSPVIPPAGAVASAESGVVVAPQAVQPAVDFGRITPAFTNWPSWNVTFTNSNSVTVQVSASLLSNTTGAYRFLSGGGTRNLGPGKSVTVKIEFNGNGQARGLKAATFRFDWSFNGSVFASDDWPLTGFVADPPDISLSGFGGVTTFLNEPVDTNVQLINNGAFPLNIDATMTLTGTDTSLFQLLSGHGAGQIAAGSNRDIAWRYLASTRGSHAANINIRMSYDGVPYAPSDFIALSGTTSLRPDFTGSQGIGFGQRFLNDPLDGVATFKNSGSLNLVINSVTLAGADSTRFQLLSGTGGGTLNPGQSRTIDVRYLADSLGTHAALVRVDFTYDGTTSSLDLSLSGDTVAAPAAALWLDDAILVQETAPSGPGLSTMTLTIDHPYAANSGSFADQTMDYVLVRGSNYVIVSEFGGSRDGLHLAQRQRLLDQLRANGFADNSREVITETLNVIGQTWMQQTTLLDYFVAALSDSLFVRHHRFGIVAQETGYYLDIKSQFGTHVSRRGNPQEALAAFRSTLFLASALEHGVLEQLQGISRPAVSTIRLMHLANQNGDKIFRADTSNWSRVQPQLTGYSSADLTLFGERVSAGATLILPANGQIVLGQWGGKGYIDLLLNPDGSGAVGMIIDGGLFGGFSVNPGMAEPATVVTEAVPELQIPAQEVHPVSKEPVDLTTGAYLFDAQDLSLGEAEPNGLHFSRRYNSDENDRISSLGNGWDHSYNIVIDKHSDVEAGLGLRTPVDAAALLVAVVATQDLMAPADPGLDFWATSALIGQWSMGQLFQNAASVRLKDQALTYIKLPDGSYNPPPGMTTDLVNTGGLFELRERFGTVIAFDANDRISSWTDVDGSSMAFAYTGTNLSAVTDNQGRTLTLGYTGNQLTSVTDSAGRSIGYSYDGNGDLITVTDTGGKSWGFGYDTVHRITTISDPLGMILATNTYNALGDVDTQTYPRDAGGTVTFNYYFSDFRNIEEDSDGNQTIYFIDRKRRTVAVQDALGNLQSTRFDGQNHTLQSTDARGNVTTFVYDGNQNLTGVSNALNQQTSNSYDARFRLTATTDPLNNSTQFAYDAEHHLIQTTDALGNTTAASYFADGRIQTSTDGRSTVTRFTYDTFGNPATTRVAAHPAVTHSYDAIGRRLSLTDQAGAVTRFSYDNRDLVTEITGPLLQKTLMTYDDAGRLTTRTDRSGNTVSFAYTPTGKVKTITYPDAGTVSFSYSLATENTDSMTDALGTSSYVYDAANRLTGQTDPQGFAVSYSYDAAGNLTTLTYPGNKTVTYTYDALNRLSTVSTWLGQTATYSYDAAGRLTQLVNFNGSVTDYSYDNADRLTGLSSRKADSTLINSHSFTLDANGNRTQETRQAPSVPSNWATESVPFTYNANRNRLLNTDTDSFAYDLEGQQTDKNGTNHSWDFEHRLTQIGADTQFFYDGVGNRLKVTRSGVTTKYIYDASGNLLAEADDTNTIIRYYIHGLGLLAAVTPGGQSYSYHFDAVGNTIALTDASETIVNTYSYSPYGQIVNQGEGIPQPFKYVGQYGVMAEPDSLYYMRARYYDPGTGRFISEDPAGLDAGVNLYAYAGGNPVLFSDPSGLCPNCITGIVGAVVNVGVTASFGDTSTSDLLIAAATGFAGGFLGPAAAKLVGTSLNSAAKITAGAFGSGTGNAASQFINTGTINPVPVGIAATGGGLAAAATLPLGTSALEAFSGGVISSQFGLASGAANAIYDRTQGQSQSGKRF